AKDLFRQHGARLVLTTRWSVPEAAEWQERIDEGGKIGNALRTVRDLTAEGAEIELVQADCTDFQSLAAAVKAGENRFGEVNAVVHAANASRVYLVLEVTREEEERSFAVKVHGALHLEALFAERFLDFMIHFSSQASIAPNPGQSAYSGANAILNALAERRRNAGLGFACAIGWGAWEQIGMAESLAASKIEGNKRDDNSRITPSTAGGLDHPLLSHRQMVSDSNEVFTAWLAPGTNRLIDSHTFRGRRLVAGVVIIECMRAAAALRLGADTGIELYNVVFLRPLFVENTGCEMLINVGQTNDELLISVTARSNDESGEETVHSQAQARLIDSGAPRMRCELPGPFDAFKLMDFRGEYISDQGDWACECADLCSDSTWSRTRIPEGRDGWDDYGIYPPLLDHAILSQMAVKRPDVVPQSVDRIRFLGPVGKQITVHGSGSGSDVQYIDASCFNDAGELILEVSGWSLKAVESSAMVERTSDTSSATNTVVPNRRLTVSRLGEFDSIGLESANISSPRPDEIQVQIVAAGLNFRDVLAVLGQLPSTEVGIDEIGSECSGYVTAVGNSVTQFKVGDAVMGSGNGLFADFANINEKVAVHIPEGIIMEHAAGIIGVFCTAEYALNRLAQLRRGEKVLIHAGAGGVGLAAIQLALNTGAEVYATAGSEAKKQYLLNLGVRHVASSRSLDFADEIRAQAGSLDVILNSLSGDFITESLGLLRRHGRFIEIGKKDILNNSRIGLLAMRDNLSFSVLDVGVMFADFEDEILDCLERVRIGFADGSLNVLPTEVIDIDKASEGFRRMSRGKHTGKIVFSVGGHSDPWRASALSFFKHFGRGISISAGQEIFSRLLSADALPSTVVAVAPGADVFGHQKDPKQPRDKAVTHAAEDAPTANAELNRHQAFLVDLWCKVSGIDDIKIEDDFFNLGGDSIMAIQIQYAIAREYDCNVSASLVSDFRTIDAMAEYLETI
ncbi:MAG: SDR family NAD(P)-dependent oxidoreductase, partial [bacterium]